MKEDRYFALPANDVEDTGFDAGPVEVETEISEYDFDDLEEAGSEPEAVGQPAPAPPSNPAVMPSQTGSDSSEPPPPKKPVARALPEKKSPADTKSGNQRGAKAAREKSIDTAGKSSGKSTRPAKTGESKKAKQAPVKKASPKKAPAKTSAKSGTDRKKAPSKGAKPKAPAERRK